MDNERYLILLGAILDKSLNSFKSVFKDVSSQELGIQKYNNAPLLFLIFMQKDQKKIDYIWNKIDFKTTDKNKTNLLMCLTNQGNLEMIEKTLPYIDINAVNKNKENALFFTTNPTVLKFLIKHGANLNQTNNDGHNLLNYHATNQETFQFLLSEGMDYKTFNVQCLEKEKNDAYQAIINSFKEKELLENTISSNDKSKKIKV